MNSQQYMQGKDNTRDINTLGALLEEPAETKLITSCFLRDGHQALGKLKFNLKLHKLPKA